jgi:hypothetical protein
MIAFAWICVAVSAFCLVFSQCIYWYDINKSKLWFDEHLKREGQPVPKRGGIRWWLFLWLHRKLNKRK